jgi:predicted nucleic acid-binding protein
LARYSIKGRGKPGAEEVRKADWIEVKSLKEKAELSNFPGKLGEGEKEAILLAEELKATLLIDDPPARKEAKKRNLPLISTLDLLQEAKSRKLIPNVKKTLDQLIIAGFCLKKKLYQEILEKVGELTHLILSSKRIRDKVGPSNQSCLLYPGPDYFFRAFSLKLKSSIFAN